MKSNEQYEVGKAMTEHGGSFVCALGNAVLMADPQNAQRIKDAFPVYWGNYAELAETQRLAEKEKKELEGQDQ